MNPVPLFLIIVTLPLLLGGCGENNGKKVVDKVRYEPEIRFETKAGETYFEYERKDGTRFLSIIAWDEWDLEQYGLEFIKRVVWNE